MNWRDLGSLLLGGFRLSLLMAPTRTVLDAGASAFVIAVLLLAGIGLSWQWVLIEPPRQINTFGVQSLLVGVLLQIVAAALQCAVCARRRILWTVASWLQAALLLPAALIGLASLPLQRDGILPIWLMIAALMWQAAVHLRLAWFLSGGRVLRTLAAAALSLAVVMAPWYVLRSQYLWTRDWAALREEADRDIEMYEQPGMLADPESVMYDLGTRIDAATTALAPQRAGVIDLYVLAFGGDASENVFRNEVDYVERLFPQRFDAAGRVLGLLNHPDSAATRPLATATNLERGLAAIGERVDPAEDIVFVYLTSHGSEDHELYVNQPPLPFDQVTPERLRAALDASGIRWRVVVVSACYSGGFIDALRDPQTLVVTAARADRPSFGCGSESDITWFGNAFIVEALNRTTDLREAYEIATATIAEREKAEEFDPSEPQWDAGDQVLAHLARWRAGFTPGPALAFSVPTEGDTKDAGALEANDVRKAAGGKGSKLHETPDTKPVHPAHAATNE